MATAQKNKALPLKHSDIPRCIPGTKLSDPAIKELAVKASILFGYNKLSQAAGIATESLTVTLAKLQIEVLDREAVDEYKQQKTRPDMGEPVVNNEENDDEEERSERRYRWRVVSIDDFDKPIPERILAKCVQIKEAHSSAQFNVHFLERNTDPFMEVHSGNERYFFEVWDEPNFAGKLTLLDAERANLRNKPTEGK